MSEWSYCIKEKQIPEFIDNINNNYFGMLDDVKIGSNRAVIESIWTDADGEIMLHVDHEKFEGDIQLFSLPDKEIIRVFKSIQKAQEQFDFLS